MQQSNDSWQASAAEISRYIMQPLQQLMPELARRCPDGRLPDSYLVVDVETSGFRHSPSDPRVKPDVVVQLGYAVVRDRKLVECTDILLKRPPGTMSAGASRVTGITDEILADGVEPALVYEQFVELCNVFRGAKMMFIGHNMIFFDAPFIAADSARCGHPFKFAAGEILDSGVIYKAGQMRVIPNARENLHTFMLRVANTHSRVKWNLTLAIQSLGIDKANGLDMSKAHAAGFDCQVTHLLIEELRKLGGLA